MNAPPASSPTTRRAALTVATLTSFIGPFLASSVNVALPSMGSELGMGAVSLAWINTAFLLAASVLLVPFGRLGDLYGRLRLFVVGVVALAGASALIATAGSGSAVIFWRVAQGLGTSMVLATALPILVAVVPQDERGSAIGINVAAVYLGLSTGPYLGGLLTGLWSWRGVFWLYLPLGALVLVVALTLLPDDRPPREGRGRTRFDLPGALLLSASLLALMFGISDLGAPVGTLAALAGALGMVAFVAWEGRAAEPLLDLDLFRKNAVFAFSNAAALIHYAATFAVTFLMSLFLQRVQGFPPQTAGLILIAQPAMQALLSPLAGRLSDRFQPRTVASTGMAITLGGLLLLTSLDASSTVGAIVLRLVVLGFGFGLFSSPNTNAIMGAVEPSQYGLAGAMVGTMRQLGMMLSMAVVMLLLSRHVGNAEIVAANADELRHAMRVSFVVFSVLCLGGIFASLARGRSRLDPPG
jgi:EmrB/QacA subfamily drug resistance transporter